ncbi:hypothetical protein [Calidifontibacter indicus]|uniref:hypothetical protein n=1 Tax=Calidifontibacter indicus TaxID=419650 RepID=UPI003D75C016
MEQHEPMPGSRLADVRLQIPGAHADGYLSAVEWRFVAGGVGTGGTVHTTLSDQHGDLGTGLQTMVAQIAG